MLNILQNFFGIPTLSSFSIFLYHDQIRLYGTLCTELINVVWLNEIKLTTRFANFGNRVRAWKHQIKVFDNHKVSITSGLNRNYIYADSNSLVPGRAT